MGQTVMKISAREQDNITIFTIEGRVDNEGAVEVDSTLQQALTSNKHNMILDMSGVIYISSAGLRVLADVLTQNRDAGGDLKLVGVTKKVNRVLQIIGFTNYFSLYDTSDAAIADF